MSTDVAWRDWIRAGHYLNRYSGRIAVSKTNINRNLEATVTLLGEKGSQGGPQKMVVQEHFLPLANR
jgi:hypothetical protein